jgi:flagellar hook-basal body complex protein FliE
MSIAALDAANAYASSLSRVTGGGSASSAVEVGGINMGAAPVTADGFSFGNLIEQTLTNTIEASKAAEAMTAKAVQGGGKVDLVEVVTAVNNAELALETVVAMRDRMISAYQEIMRMPI